MVENSASNDGPQPHDTFILATASEFVVSCTFFNELDINRQLSHDLIPEGQQKIVLDLTSQYSKGNHFKFHREIEKIHSEDAIAGPFYLPFFVV